MIDLPSTWITTPRRPLIPRVFRRCSRLSWTSLAMPPSRGHSLVEAESAVDLQTTGARFAECPARCDRVGTSGATRQITSPSQGVLMPTPIAGTHHHAGDRTQSVLDPCKWLESRATTSATGVNRFGRIDLDELRGAIRPDTILVSIMWANNEIARSRRFARSARCARTRRPLSYRCHAGRRQIAHRRGSRQRRSAFDERPQDVRPKGLRLSVRAQQTNASSSPRDATAAGMKRGYRSGTLNVPESSASARRVRSPARKWPPRFRVFERCATASNREYYEVDGVW